MRAVAYLRVSSASQVEGHSLDAQERLFRELCKNRGWETIHIYREEGKSAHVESIARRPVFRQLLQDAAKGGFETVVVHTLDRWSRNMKITLESLSILAKSNVSLVSITENIDYTTPQGKLFTNMIGSFAEYFSSSLSTHVKKGLSQRAEEGKHTGPIPFGYESCWIDGEKGERVRRCDPEHPAGIHIHQKEGQAVADLFKRYAAGPATLGGLAAILNERGFRTRNIQRLPDAAGNLSSGPRLFTTASVRGILHNQFYAGKISYQGKLMQGTHEPVVGQAMFDLVQSTMRKNSGRSETLAAKPEREYLLKGIVRCAYCGMPMWAQTYHNGEPYYREHRASRSSGICSSGGSSIPCKTIDDQVRDLVGAIELRHHWLEQVLAIVSLKDEVDMVAKKRKTTEEKLRRMAKAYVDGLFPDEEYRRQKRLLEMELESLVVPEANATEDAGNLILSLPKVWAGADMSEQRRLLLLMLDAVYVDAKKSKSIIALKPKPPFRPIFMVAATKAGSQIRIINEPLDTKPPGSSVFVVEAGEG